MDPDQAELIPARFSLLATDQVRELNLAALDVLYRIGVHVHLKEALDLFHQAGAEIEDGLTVHIPNRLVESAIAAAPKRVVFCDRNGRRRLEVGGSKVYFGPGPTTPSHLDVETGERRPTTKQDVANVAKVCDYLPNIDWVMSLGLVSDCVQQLADVHEFEAMLLNTTKPILGWSYGAQGCRDIAEMCAAVAGGMDRLKRSPFVGFLVCPESPLLQAAECTERLLVAAELELPVAYLAGPTAGATGPVSEAGAIVVGTADILSGLVVHQLKRPGAPFIFGSMVTPMDMRTGIRSYGAPEMSLFTNGVMEVARSYGLPVMGTAGCTDSKVFDQQAAIESTMSVMAAILSCNHMVHDVGFMDAGLASSLDMLVASDAIIGSAKRYLGGIRVNRETLALDVVEEIGPAGQFLTHEHTYKHFRNNWTSDLMDRLDYNTWDAAGRETLGGRARRMAREILSNHQPEPLPEEVIRQIQAVVQRAEELEKATVR